MNNQLLYLINQTFILNPYLILIMSIIALVYFVIFSIYNIFIFRYYIQAKYKLDIIIPLTVIISPIIIILLLKKNQYTIYLVQK
jgi:hypothetical protein